MAKQLNVDLRFNADTSQAKKAIQDLQNTLNNLSTWGTAASTTGFNQQIASATVEANKLKVALADAFNTKTGAIDLSKLQANLRQAGSSIEQVSNSLINMGPVGQRAFQQFAATIAQAQVPTMRLNGLLGEMWTTLKNVARFQISSSIIHGLIGGVQSAFSYAQNLNQSLNNIRIVTGDNVEKMAQFAREANNAAKALSATTLDYTNASLIYYQQGLDDQAVKARTDVTVKLANVTRQSAEEVSSQMTAIWNNFDNGAHSMEYFADVITALGATTASSSAEIAQGLQKFAPIAGTIGLSYEKATAALAAIIATTRQSADTVGTGLRTIFSRFESLKLGKTLEDGVDLNKYTNAMKTIGVNVLDANGKLREMDDILDDIAENWQKLDNTQKTAFATTVGGVRQYTNLMALFENWDKVQQNLVTATGAEGTLQGQADIYAESWEAARDRVKTALQGLYDSLINDDFFIDLLNGIEKLLTGVDRFVQSLGGARGVILGVAAAILSFANTGVSSAISNMTYNIMSLTGAGQKRADEMRDSMINKALNLQISGSPVEQARSQALKDQVSLQNTLNQYGRDYNNIQRSIAQSLIEQHKQQSENLITAQQELQQAQNRLQIRRQQLEMEGNDLFRSDGGAANFQNAVNLLGLRDAAELYGISTNSAREYIQALNEVEAATEQVSSANRNNTNSLEATNESLKNLKATTMTGSDILTGFTSGITSAVFAFNMLSGTVKTLGDESATTGQKITSIITTMTMATPMLLRGIGQLKNSFQGLGKNAVEEFNKLRITDVQNLVGTRSQFNWVSPATYADKQQQIKDISRAFSISEKKAELALNEALAKSNGQLTAEELKEALAKQGVNIAGEKTILTKTKEAIARKLVTLKIKEETAAALASLGVYALIVVAIAAVVAAIYLAIKAYNADAIAAKKAAEAHKELQQKSKDAAQELQNIKQAFEGYDNAVKALEKCTKGTEEWYNALKAVNDQVLSIMENNPELAKQMQTHRDKETGMLVIDNKDQLINQAQTIADNARNAAIMGAVSASSAQLTSDTTNFRRRFAAEYDETGTQIGGIAPEIMTKALNNLKDYAGQTVAEIADSFKDSIPSDQLDKFAEGLYELAKSSSDLANQMENAANAVAEYNLGSEYSGAAKEYASEAYEAAYDRFYEEAINNGKNGINAWSGKNDSEVIAFWDQYSKATGTHFALDNNAVVGTDSNRYFQYLDNGEKKKVSLEEMAAAIAAAKALEELTGSANEAAKSIANLETNTGDKNIATALENYLATGSLGNVTKQDISNIQSAMGKDPAAYLRSAFGDTIVDKMLESNPEWVNNFVKSLEIDFAHIGSGLTSTAKRYFNKIPSEIKDSLGAEDLENLSNLFGETFEALGKSGVENLQKIISTLSPEEAQKFIEVLQGMDWSTAGPNTFTTALEDAGLSALTAAPAIIKFADAMREAGHAAGGFDTAAASYAEVHKIIDKLGVGGTVSDEDYKKLESLGVDIDTFFTQLADGTHMLTGDAKEFYDIINNATLEGFQNIINSAEEKTSRIESVNSSGFTLEQLQSTAGQAGIYGSARNVNNEQVGNQLSLLQSVGYSDNNALNEWQARLEEGTLQYDDIKKIAEAVSEATSEFETMEEVVEAVKDKIEEDTTKSKEAIENAHLLDAINKNGFEYKEIKEYADYLKDYLGEAAEKLSDNQLKELALKQKMLERGFNTLSGEQENFYKQIKEGTTGTAEFHDSLKKMQDGMEDLIGSADFDADGTIFDQKFFEDNEETIKKVLNGDKAALEALRLEAAKKVVINFDKPEDIKNKLNEIINSIDLPDDIEIGTRLEQIEGYEDWINSLNEMLAAGEMTVDEVNQVLSSMGFEPTVAYRDVDASMSSEEQVTGSTTLSSGEDSVTVSSTTVGSSAGGTTASIPYIDASATTYSGGGGKKKKSGGGGGSGGSKAKTHTHKQRDNNDRYKPILAKQDDKKRQIDAAKDRADRLAGKARIDNLREENKLLGDNIELQKEYINEITNYLAQDKDDMVNALAGFGLTIDFDPNGVINNYDAIMDKLYAIYNQKADQAMDEDAWKKFEDSWQNAIDAVNQYIETRDLEEEQQENLNDMLNEQLDQLLEIVNTELELNIQVNDQDLNLLDHLLNKVNDDAYKAAEAIALMGDKAAKELERANYYQGAINSTLATYGLDSVDQLLNMSPEELQGLGITQDTIDNLIDWNNELLDITETLDDLQKEIREKVIDTFDELNEKVQDSYDFFSHYNTLLESYRNIADLNTAAIGKESRELIRMLDNSMLRNSQNALRSSKQIYDKLVEDRQIAQQKLQEAEEQGLIGEADAYRDLIEDIDGQIRDAQEQWLADWEDGLQKAKDILERSVDDAVKNYEELLAPLYGSLDALNDVYEMRKEVDADYVQDYEKLYQLNKLNRDLEKTLNDVQGIQNRKQLLALQEKINKLQKDGTKMSEYDLEVLEKEFEVQQARIALEEAANAKSTVRLQRDNEGNWGYVYAADADTIEEAQQNYEDKLYEYQKLNDEYIREMSDKLMELSSTAKEKIAEVWADSTLSPEEKQAKTDEIVAWFNAQRDFIGSQMQNALDNQQNLTQRFYDTYQNTYAEVMDTYEETMLAEATKIDNLNEWLATLSTGFNNLLDEVQVASDVYLEHIAETNEAAGSSIEDLADDITDAAAAIDEASLQNVENIEELAQAVQDGLVSALDSAIEQEARLAEQIATVTQQIEGQYQAWNNVYRMLNQVGDAATAAYYPLDTLARSTEQYGINQPSYNPDDWVANEQISGVFDNVYNQDYWQQQHQYADELQDAIQEWMSLLSMQALTAMGGFGTLTSPYYQEAEDGTLQQEVHIEANFPGVTDRSQIEEAFENLVNKAAQFANRKRQG